MKSASNSVAIGMNIKDVEYTYIEENSRQFRLLTCTSFIGQFVHPVGEARMILWGDRYKFHLISCKIKEIINPFFNTNLLS